MSVRVIDAHLHLDESVDGPAEAAVDALAEELRSAGVERGVVLHLESQRWSIHEVAKALRQHREVLAGFVNLHPNAPDSHTQFRTAIEDLGFSGLKLHPRLQGFALTSPETADLVRLAGQLGVPVIVDAFPDGEWLLDGHSVSDFGRLARACSDTTIVAAHMGGHHVLDLMMIAKRNPNLYLDMSYSLLYYRTSSVTPNLVYAMRSMKFDRIFYGSDYPDRSIEVSLSASLKVLREHRLDEDSIDRLVYRNARSFFSWGDEERMNED